MQFLNPSAFYLLLTIPLVLALHFLKLRRQTYRVPSIMLWLPAAEDNKANVPFQRLRNYLLPLLQGLFLLLLTLSVARPVLYRAGLMPGKSILIIDNSASMQSKETGKTRLELAKQEALRLIREVSAKHEMMVLVTHGVETYIQQAFTTDAEKLRQAVKNIVPTHAVDGFRTVFDAAAHYADSAQDRVFFISDSFHNLPQISLPLYKIGVGGKAKNVEIAQFRVEMKEGQYLVLISIQNWTDALVQLDVALKVEGNLLDEKPEPISIPARKTQTVLFSGDASGLDGLVMSAHLEVEDDFLLDNSAAALLRAQPTFYIQLVSDREQPLLNALLRTYGNHVKLRRVSTGTYHGRGDANLTIFDGFVPDTVPNGGVIFINPTVGEQDGLLPPNSVEAAPNGKSLQVIDEDKTHLVMKGISLIGLPVRKVVSRELPPWGRSLAETESGSLIWLGTDVGNRHLLVLEFDAFNPEISEFALTIPAVPRFIYQCLNWLEARTSPLQPLMYREDATPHAFRTGESVRIVVPTEKTSDIRVRKPDGTAIELNGAIFTHTDLIGTYTVLVEDTPLERFTVNLLNPEESALLTPSTLPVAPAGHDEEIIWQPIMQDVWRLPALIGFLILVLEWWCYHRRTR